jgi:glycosyltransferase involved in cell wall biosynthesis/2-polyprenyl-3-methyl-5-hydroxy-6-metoxy-1,4-benzoquinol methylase
LDHISVTEASTPQEVELPAQPALQAKVAPMVPAEPGGSDRISEFHRDEIFAGKSGRIARERVHWMCQQCDGESVLDVGCSEGITAVLLAREGFAVTAIDADPASIKFAAAEFAREAPHVRKRLSLVETDLASLPEATKFDTVLLGKVLEHQALPERLIRQAVGRLKPGGVLVIATPFGWNPQPDHKVDIMPRHLAEFAASLDLEVTKLDVHDGYIRCVLRSNVGWSQPLQPPSNLLLLTEAATLASQRLLFDRLDERANLLSRRAKNLEDAQAQIAQMKVAALEASAEHARSLQALMKERDGAARMAETAADEARRCAHAADVEHSRAVERLVAEHKRALTELKVLHAGVIAKLQAQLSDERTAALERERRHAAAFDEKLEEQTQALRAAVREAEVAMEHAATLAATRYQGLRDQLEVKSLAHLHERTDLRRKLVQLRENRDHLRASSSLRLGRALVRSLQSVRGALDLPGELVSISRDAWGRQRARQAGKADEFETDAEPSARAELDIASLVETYKSGGFEALRLALHTVLTPAHGVDIPTALLKVGKALSVEGNTSADFELATQALAIDGSERTLRGYFWATQRAAEFERGFEAVRRIEALYGENPNVEQRAMLTKLRSQPAYRLKILDLVSSTPRTRIEPVPGRICYVLHNSLPYSSGGYGTRGHGVALGLAAAGYDVVALTRPGFPLDLSAGLSEESTPLEDVIDGLRYVRTLHPQRRGMTHAQYLAAAADAVEAQLVEIRPSLVMAASNHVTSLPALIAARRLGLPFIYEVRGLWEITRLSREPEFEQTAEFEIQRLLETQVCVRADHVFTLTEPMRDELVERGVPRERIDLLPNSCDPARFTPRQRDESLAQRLGLPAGVPVIGYIGTFVEYEGLDDLAMACALLKRRGVAFRLMLVGNENASGLERGPISLHVESIAVTEGFSDWLVMPGRVPHEEVEAYYSLVDIAPFPRKPLPVCEMVSPMKPLEALAMEKAVVVSSVRALTEIVDDRKTGRVFDKGDLTSLADVLQALIDSPDDRLYLGRRGREWVCAERTWSQMGQRFREIMKLRLPAMALAPEEVARGVLRPPLSAQPVSLPGPAVTVGAVSEQSPPSNLRPQDDRPPWWNDIDAELRQRCGYVDVRQWTLSDEAVALRASYLARFDAETVARRIPPANWARADICAQTVEKGDSLLDVGSGLGEFINLIARSGQHGRLTSVDVRDWDLWFDATGNLHRLQRDFFDLDASCASDVVTCFEVIEHLPTERVADAVELLRSLARKKLYVSVPFMEAPPLYRGHLTRFDESNLLALFPEAKFTVYGRSSGKEVRAWVMCEIDLEAARSSVPCEADEGEGN